MGMAIHAARERAETAQRIGDCTMKSVASAVTQAAASAVPPQYSAFVASIFAALMRSNPEAFESAQEVVKRSDIYAQVQDLKISYEKVAEQLTELSNVQKQILETLISKNKNETILTPIHTLIEKV